MTTKLEVEKATVEWDGSLRPVRGVIVLLAALFVPATAAAEGYKVRKERSTGAVVTLEMDRQNVPLSDIIEVKLTVEGAAPLEVEPIRFLLPDTKEWDEKAMPEAKPVALPGGRARWQQAYHLNPLKEGESQLRLAPIRFREGKSETWVEQAWAPVPVVVTTTVQEPKLDNMRPNTPIEELPGEPEEAQRGWWMAGGLGGVLAAVVSFWLWLRRRKPQPQTELTPYQWAVRELERIEALGLPTEGGIEPYHTRLSGVLRHYLERRFSLRAPEQTTQEFLEGLRRSSALPPEQQELLREFLGRCDLAKFACAEFSADDCRIVGQMARQFVEQTAPSVQPGVNPEANGHVLAGST